MSEESSHCKSPAPPGTRSPWPRSVASVEDEICHGPQGIDILIIGQALQRIQRLSQSIVSSIVGISQPRTQVEFPDHGFLAPLHILIFEDRIEAPAPGSATISSRTCSSTGTGSAAGPAEKLNTRCAVVVDVIFG